MTFHKPALCLAVEKGNIEIIKLLLSNQDIKINEKFVLIDCYLIKFQIHCFLCHFIKLSFLFHSKFQCFNRIQIFSVFIKFYKKNISVSFLNALCL